MNISRPAALRDPALHLRERLGGDLGAAPHFHTEGPHIQLVTNNMLIRPSGNLADESRISKENVVAILHLQ